MTKNGINSNGNGTSQKVQGVTTPAIATDPSNGTKNSADSSADAGLSEPDHDRLIDLMTEMRSMLPFLKDLTAEERKTLLGMGDKNRTFAGKVLDVAKKNPDFLPRSFDLEKMQQNLATFDRLSSVLRSLNQLRDLVDATVIGIGTEVFEDALTAYRHAQASHLGASLEGMMADMGQRFARQPKKKEAGKDTEEASVN